MKRCNMERIIGMGAVAALALVLAPAAKAERNPCSVATLRGSFARTDTGFLTSPAAIAGPIAGVSLMTFDGNGGFTSTGMGGLNGNVAASTSTGTYTVNADCTGTYTGVSSRGTGHAFFVIAAGGDEIHILVTDPGVALTCIARRIFPQGSSLD